MNKRIGFLAVIVTISCIATANATIVLDFSGLQNLEPIENYYNGGNGGFGSGPGPSYGIGFGSDSLAIISELDGGTGNFQNAPGGSTIAFFLQGNGDVMDKASGFTTGFSFYYSASSPGSVSVYSGLDGSGTQLTTLDLPTTPQTNGGSTYYNTWYPVGVNFAGTAESVVFSGAANYIGFSDITLGSATAGGTIPEPSTCIVWSLLGGIGVAFGICRCGRPA